MNPAIFDDLEHTLAGQGPAAAFARLAETLRDRKDYDGLFYARLAAKRHELGVSPVPTGPVADVPEARQSDFEDAIRRACREVGGLYLADGQIAQAWSYFKMINEPGPVEESLAGYTPREDEDLEPLIGVALYEGVLPRKGFDWVLERYGLCSAITTLGGGQLPLAETARQYCVGRVLANLYEELRGRLAAEIERIEGQAPPEASAPPGTPGVVRKLIAGRDGLFADDCYHIDFSHLSSAVQMALDLGPGIDLEIARELCEYGAKLSPSYRGRAEPPFDDPYVDQGIYLAVLGGHDVEAGLAHFRAKAEANPVEEAGTGPAEMLVQLLTRIGRPKEALEAARRYLDAAENSRLAYTADLCRKAGDYRPLVEAARAHGNPVQFLAGLLAQRDGNGAR